MSNHIPGYHDGVTKGSPERCSSVDYREYLSVSVWRQLLKTTFYLRNGKCQNAGPGHRKYSPGGRFADQP
jgi:hypothetical protein